MTQPRPAPELDNYRTIADAIATLFFPHAEVVLHDLRTQKVDYIANNISKRVIGDDAALDDMRSGEVAERPIGPTKSSTGTARIFVRSAACCATPTAHPSLFC